MAKFASLAPVTPSAQPAAPLFFNQSRQVGKASFFKPKINKANSEHNAVEKYLENSRGNGKPLPIQTKQMLEPLYGANFSSVRIHDDKEAGNATRKLKADAFTSGNDIYFNTHKYQPETTTGNKLLAHELSHTLQTENSTNPTVRRQPDPASQPDTPPAEESSWDPIVTLSDFLDEASKEQEEAGDDPWSSSDVEGETAASWMGGGDEGRRKVLLLKVEMVRLGQDDERDSTIKDFSQEADPASAYIDYIKSNLDVVASHELQSLDYINEAVKLQPPATPENFIDDPFLQGFNVANAFPDLSWNIVKDLITPPLGIVTEAQDHLARSKPFFDSAWALMDMDIYEKGFPLSYSEALQGNMFRLIRQSPVKKLDFIPDQKFITEIFLWPVDSTLITPIMRQSIDSFAYLAVSSVKDLVVRKWQEPSTFKWFNYDTLGISKFRKQYPKGLSYADQFYGFQNIGLGFSLEEIAYAVLLGFNIGGRSPYEVLGFKSAEARNESPALLATIVKETAAKFDAALFAADTKIAQLPKMEKLEKAVNWSLEKGYAGQSINILLDQLDEIAADILRSWVKEKAIKKGVSWVVGTFGGPIGRLATVLYSAYDTYDDIEDLTEIIGLVEKLTSIINGVRDAKTVHETQRGAARLAEASVSIIPLILEQLGSKLLDRLAKGVPKDQPGTISEAKRTKLVDDSASKDNAKDLKSDEVDAEVLTAIKSKVYRSSKKEYNAIVVLPNGHQWRRNQHGIWCRASKLCVLPSSKSAFINELNKKVDASIQHADVFDPDQAIEPEVERRSIAAEKIGAFHGAEYAVNTLGLTPLDLPNPFTKANFSDTGFDDIMEDSAGNWYIVEYKGGDSEINPGTARRPPQMSSAWVGYVLARVRREKPAWASLYADPIEQKLREGKLYGYAISTPINEAGIVMPTVIMEGYNKIKFQ